ncbi:MAG: hypothetical protein IPK82_40360 [Polyangiaceae bacterium]|nr:hypothetical protein [Polyangiaceae bacterium]
MLGKIGSVGLAGVIGIAASLLGGCSNTPVDTDNTDTVNGPPEGAALYYRDVKPILDAKCNNCHNASGIGPFSLETFEDAKPLAGLIKDEVVAKRMPPWPANEACNDYWGDRSLTDEQVATITKWVDDGAFEGDAEDEGKKLTSGEKFNCRGQT